MASPSDPSSQSSRPSKSSDSSPPTSTGDNPFVAFRRFTDSQISSFLQSIIGVPSLFSQPEPSHRWSSVDDLMTRHTGAVLHTRQELASELSKEAVEHCHRDCSKTERRAEEMRQWGAFLDASSAETESNKEQDVEAAGTCKHHEKLGWDGRRRHGSGTSQNDQMRKDRDERFIVSTSQGKVGLKRVVDRADEGLGFWVDKDESRLRFNNTENVGDPFVEPARAISWLLGDSYSPLYLDRSLQYKLEPSWWKCDKEDSYFNRDYQSGDLNPLFAAESIQRHDPRLANKVNWRAAFHDLLDIHHKDALPPTSRRSSNFDPPTKLTPSLWIAYLIDSDSLGPGWHTEGILPSMSQPAGFRFGNLSSAWSVKAHSDQIYVRDGKARSPLPRFGRYEMKNDSLPLIRALADSSDSSPSPRDLQNEVDRRKLAQHAALVLATLPPFLTEGSEEQSTQEVGQFFSINRNPEFLQELRDISLAASEGRDVRSSVTFTSFLDEQDRLGEGEKRRRGLTQQHPPQHGGHQKELKVESDKSASTPAETEPSHAYPPSSSSSSSSSYSFTHDQPSSNNGVDCPNSIVATLTSLETRTLPDGSMETKRALKKRFADGREECNESIETQFDNHCRDHPQQDPPPRPDQQPAVAATTTMALDSDEQPKHEPGRKIGWFWN